MSLAQRVREFRYSKGWGPDELASRAEISRTALYQIESGKTELPRAGTLRRIAVALDVPMEDLLGSAAESETDSPPVDRQSAARVNRSKFGWSAAEEAPVRAKVGAAFTGLNHPLAEDIRPSAESLVKPRTLGPDKPFAREGELMSKLHDLLHSHLGECITKIVDDLHQVLSEVRSVG
jgi:transcriptional regulator with XRE-family HTH domain